MPRRWRVGDFSVGLYMARVWECTEAAWLWLSQPNVSTQAWINMDGQIKRVQMNSVKSAKQWIYSGTRTGGCIDRAPLAHTQSQRLCCMFVSLSGRWRSCMYAVVCIVYVQVPVSVCICMCVCWLPNVESRKRKRLDGWRGCLFIHYPAASVVSGGHGNTCPGPFSTGLFVACFGPAKAFSSHLLCSPLFLLLLFFYFWIVLRLSLLFSLCAVFLSFCSWKDSSRNT